MAKELSKRKSGRINPAIKIAANVAFDADGKPKPALGNAMLRAVEVQRPVVLANLRRMRRRYPHATPGELSARIEKDFLRAVSGGGAAIGATAIVPGLGTVASLGISAAATVVFLETTALYAQSIAELHGVRLADPERSSALVMAVMLGEEGASMVEGFAGHAAGRGTSPLTNWGKAVGTSMPRTVLKGLSGRLQKAFLRRFMMRETGAIVGRAIPFGIGAVVGGVGNLLMGRAVVHQTKLAFGPAPEVWPEELKAELDKTGGKKFPGLVQLSKDQIDKIAASRVRQK